MSTIGYGLNSNYNSVIRKPTSMGSCVIDNSGSANSCSAENAVYTPDIPDFEEKDKKPYNKEQLEKFEKLTDNLEKYMKEINTGNHFKDGFEKQFYDDITDLILTLDPSNNTKTNIAEAFKDGKELYDFLIEFEKETGSVSLGSISEKDATALYKELIEHENKKKDDLVNFKSTELMNILDNLKKDEKISNDEYKNLLKKFDKPADLIELMEKDKQVTTYTDGKIKTETSVIKIGDNKIEITNKYDKKGNLISQDTYVQHKDGTYTKETKEYKNGELSTVKKVDKDIDGNKTTSFKKYNDGVLATDKTIKANPKGVVTSTTVKEYDNNGKLTKYEFSFIDASKTKKTFNLTSIALNSLYNMPKKDLVDLISNYHKFIEQEKNLNDEKFDDEKMAVANELASILELMNNLDKKFDELIPVKPGNESIINTNDQMILRAQAYQVDAELDVEAFLDNLFSAIS